MQLLRTTQAMLLLLTSPCFVTPAQGQDAPCGLSSITRGTEAYYPPIGRAAHVQGTVVMLVTFQGTGTVLGVQTLYGSKLLAGAAETVATNLVANTYGGVRQCPIVITYQLRGPLDRECDDHDIQKEIAAPTVNIIDVQHYFVTAENNCLVYQRDPAGRKLKRFHLF